MIWSTYVAITILILHNIKNTNLIEKNQKELNQYIWLMYSFDILTKHHDLFTYINGEILY